MLVRISEAQFMERFGVGPEQLFKEDKLHRVHSRIEGILEEVVFLVDSSEEDPHWVFISGLASRLFEPGPFRTVIYYRGQGTGQLVANLAVQHRLADAVRGTNLGWSMGGGPIFEGSQSYGLPGTIPRYYQPERSGYDRLLQLLASGAIPSVPGSRTLLVEIVITRRSPLNDPELRAALVLSWLFSQAIKIMIEAIEEAEREAGQEPEGSEKE